jgi:15-cis-phytoene synthase
MPADDDYCAALVRDVDRDRYLATLFAPATHRDALFALYAVNAEIARIRDVAREPMPGELRLQWWREALAGERDGEAAANPLAAALMQTVERFGLPADALFGLIDARSFDLYDEPMQTFAQLESYAERVNGTIFDYALRLLAPNANANYAEVAKHAGCALTYAKVIADLPNNLARGQLYLPLQEIEHHGVTRDDVRAGRAEQGLRIVVAELAVRARAHLLAAADVARTDMPEGALPAILSLAPLRPWLTLMDRPDYQPLRPPKIAPWLRQLRIWRAAKSPARIGYRISLFGGD